MIRTCPTDGQLAWLLEADLTADAGDIAAHLGDCQRCQGRLEELAAGELTWAAVAERLARSQQHPPELAAAMAALQSTSHEGEAEASPDLPPGFFAPPRQPGHLGRVGHYEVLEEVGRGEMGIVFKAIDDKLQRVVALKVMSPRLAGHALSRKRFIREGRAAAAVCHEHVVTIHAVEDGAQLPYFVMQFVSGQSLQQRLEKSGPLSVAEILRIGMQAAAGLAAAHEQGLVHRDIKPANILLENGVERVKITDFGLARAVDDASLTRSGVVAGTPLYMAPEQARGEPVDHRADLFSLGCVLYTLATGRPPFRAATTVAVLRRICEDEPRPIRELNPEVAAWLCAIVDRLLAKDPRQRYSTASELADLLAGCLAHVQRPGSVPLPAALAGPTPVVSKAAELSPPAPAPEARRRSWLLTTPAGISLLLVAAIAPLVLALSCAGIIVMAYWMSARSVPAARMQPPLPPPAPPLQPIGSSEELEELRTLAAIAQHESQQAKAHFELGTISATEKVQAEIALAKAQARYYEVAGQSTQWLAALRRVVELREQILKFTVEMEQSGRITPAARLEAERALSEARLELRRAEAKIEGRE
jgi:serine/threonine protein kinase